MANINGTGRGDVIVGSGPGMAPTIDAFDVKLAAASYLPFKVFTPFTATFRGGVNVSAISVGSGVANPLVVASQAGTGTSTVQIFNGKTGPAGEHFESVRGQRLKCRGANRGKGDRRAFVCVRRPNDARQEHGNSRVRSEQSEGTATSITSWKMIPTSWGFTWVDCDPFTFKL